MTSWVGASDAEQRLEREEAMTKERKAKKHKYKHKLVKKSRRSRPVWHVEAQFRGGPHRRYEAMLEDLVGRRASGTGYTFRNGTRDVGWVFGSERGAKSAARRLDGTPGLRRVSVSRDGRRVPFRFLTRKDVEDHATRVVDIVRRADRKLERIWRRRANQQGKK